VSARGDDPPDPPNAPLARGAGLCSAALRAASRARWRSGSEGATPPGSPVALPVPDGGSWGGWGARPGAGWFGWVYEVTKKL